MNPKRSPVNGIPDRDCGKNKKECHCSPNKGQKKKWAAKLPIFLFTTQERKGIDDMKTNSSGTMNKKDMIRIQIGMNRMLYEKGEISQWLYDRANTILMHRLTDKNEH